MDQLGPAIAVDIGGTKTMVGVVDSMGQLLTHERFATDVTGSAETHLERCVPAVQRVLAEAGIAAESCSGIGITVPGLANPQAGVMVYAPYSGWRDVPVRDYFSHQFPGLPVAIANDVNACAVGELLFGHGQTYADFLWVTISTGIGSGIVSGGRVLDGTDWVAGELGHVVVEWDRGRRCGCGHDGCLEAHASGTAIAALAKDLVRERAAGALFSEYSSDGESVTAEVVAKAARAGVPEAVEVFHKAGTWLGRGLSYAVNLLNPGCIVIGGGVSASFDLMEAAVQRVLRTAVIGEKNQNIPLLTTALGYHAAIVGAGALVFSLRHE